MAKIIKLWVFLIVAVYFILVFPVCSSAKKKNKPVTKNVNQSAAKNNKRDSITKSNQPPAKKADLIGAMISDLMEVNQPVTEKAGQAITQEIDQTFRIGPQDVLEISVWKDPTLNKQVVVRPDGKISITLL